MTGKSMATNWSRVVFLVGISIGGLLAACRPAMGDPAPPLRRVISLDGVWDVEEGGMDAAPKNFGHTVVVPGLLDMAKPAFVEPGPAVKDRQSRRQKDPRRDAFWYRRTFELKEPVPEVAILTIGKAFYGTRVLLNGQMVGDHLPCVTAGKFDVRKYLRQGENVLLVRVGADRDAIWGRAQTCFDSEKSRFTPGIFDSVDLTLTGSPHILRIQAVPDIDKQAVTIHAWLRKAGTKAAKLHFTVREKASGKTVGEGDCEVTDDAPEAEGSTTIAIPNCRLWSPEDPFLYEVQARGDADELSAQFGMRSFRLDPKTGRAVLNGQPYFMRGSNVTLFRFFEDQLRGDKPWREEWVRRMYGAFRDMHWNSLRYCICFPPEMWYRLADEEGFLIQDEFPIWFGMSKPGDIDADELAVEYREWMQEHWNHPCVVIWDGCNETFAPETAQAMKKVRHLDYSKRPWDNGWDKPLEPSDSDEAHPYHFFYAEKKFPLKDVGLDPGTKKGLLITQPFAEEKLPRPNPIIINEYCGLWLNRDGSTTTLTKPMYEYLIGKNSTTAQRRLLYARYMAKLTEFFRVHRKAAAVLHFSALNYSRPDGQTSDNWADVEKLTWDPGFYKYVRDSFAPVGLMVDFWSDTFPSTKTFTVPVMVINDLARPWEGDVRLRLIKGEKTISEASLPCKLDKFGQDRLSFEVAVPADAGDYQLVAELTGADKQIVRSWHDVKKLATKAVSADK